MTKSRGIRTRYTRGTVIERIMANSVVSDGHGDPPQPLPCRLSTYTKNEHGYGMVNVGGKARRVHIEAYKALVGPVAPGLSVMHLCNVPACFEPTHLKVGTHKENLAYMAYCGRSTRGMRKPQPPTKKPRAISTYARGAAVKGSRLTELQVVEIRRLHMFGRSLRALAREFGVNNVTVWNVVHRRTWTHVQEAI